MWNIFKKSEEDQIGLEFISRLEKVKKFYENPYSVSMLFDYYHRREYSILFDDYKLIVVKLIKSINRYDIMSNSTSYIVRLENEMDEFSENLECSKKVSSKLFDLVKWIYDSNDKMKQRDKRNKSIAQIKLGMNKAADLL